MVLPIISFLLVSLAGVFSLLAYVYPDYAKSGKQKLRGIKVKLKENSSFTIEKNYFTRIQTVTTWLKGTGKWYFMGTMFIANAIGLFVSCYLVEFLKHGQHDKVMGQLMEWKMFQFDTTEKMINSIGIHLLAGIIGATLGYLSLKVTIFFLDRMAKAQNSWRLLKHILLDVFVVACFMAIYVIIAPLFNWLIINPEWASYEVAWNTTFVDKQDPLIPFFLAVLSGIPTIIYLSASISLLFLKIIPSKFSAFLIDLLSAMTREDRNVFGDIAKFLGVLSGIFGAAKVLFA